ncbi:hypothetical protein EJB05_52912, partial [Eragrostis curvula]
MPATPSPATRRRKSRTSAPARHALPRSCRSWPSSTRRPSPSRTPRSAAPPRSPHLARLLIQAVPSRRRPEPLDPALSLLHFVCSASLPVKLLQSPSAASAKEKIAGEGVAVRRLRQGGPPPPPPRLPPPRPLSWFGNKVVLFAIRVRSRPLWLPPAPLAAAVASSCPASSCLAPQSVPRRVARGEMGDAVESLICEWVRRQSKILPVQRERRCNNAHSLSSKASCSPHLLPSHVALSLGRARSAVPARRAAPAARRADNETHVRTPMQASAMMTARPTLLPLPPWTSPASSSVLAVRVRRGARRRGATLAPREAKRRARGGRGVGVGEVAGRAGGGRGGGSPSTSPRWSPTSGRPAPAPNPRVRVPCLGELSASHRRIVVLHDRMAAFTAAEAARLPNGASLGEHGLVFHIRLPVRHPASNSFFTLSTTDAKWQNSEHRS